MFLRKITKNFFIICCCIWYILIYISCNTQESIRPPKQSNFPYLEFGKTINDYFPEFIESNKLTEKDLKVIGGWRAYGGNDETRYIWSYVIYPNRTFSFGVNDPAAPKDSERNSSTFFYIDQGEGLWRINQNWLELKVKMILVGDSDLPKSQNYFSREMVNWDWQKVIKVSDIHKDGYTIKPFQPIKLPAELEAKLKVKPNYQPWYAFRNFGEPGMNQLLTESFQLHQYPDGTHIFDSIETYEKYLDDYYKATTW